MNIENLIVVLDAADLAAVSGFWAAVLDGSVEAGEDWNTVLGPDGAPRISVQLAPNHVPPEWPDGPQQQQLHIDLWVTDFATAHDEVIALGATLLQESPNQAAEEGWQVYADPAGHPFCLCWHPESPPGV